MVALSAAQGSLPTGRPSRPMTAARLLSHALAPWRPEPGAEHGGPRDACRGNRHTCVSPGDCLPQSTPPPIEPPPTDFARKSDDQPRAPRVNHGPKTADRPVAFDHPQGGAPGRPMTPMYLSLPTGRSDSVSNRPQAVRAVPHRGRFPPTLIARDPPHAHHRNIQKKS